MFLMFKAFLTLLLCAASATQAADAFRFPVARDKFLRDELGQLTIDDEGITYQSDNGKTSLRLAYADIRKVDVSRPNVIRLQTYDRLKRRLTGNRSYKFRLKEGVTDQRLARFLKQRLVRPLVGAYDLVGQSALEIPAYHRHRLGGCHGVLRIAEEGIQFSSEKQADSRTWLYRDVETIGSSDPFNLRVTSFAQTYTFDLKERLPQETYRLTWQRIHNPKSYNETGGNSDPLTR